MDLAPQTTALVLTARRTTSSATTDRRDGGTGRRERRQERNRSPRRSAAGCWVGACPVFVSPDYHCLLDHGWQFRGTLETQARELHMFERPDPLSLQGFQGSGADWLEQYKPYLQDGRTVVVSVYTADGPQHDDRAAPAAQRGDRQGRACRDVGGPARRGPSVRPCRAGLGARPAGGRDGRHAAPGARRRRRGRGEDGPLQRLGRDDHGKASGWRPKRDSRRRGTITCNRMVGRGVLVSRDRTTCWRRCGWTTRSSSTSSTSTSTACTTLRGA